MSSYFKHFAAQSLMFVRQDIFKKNSMTRPWTDLCILCYGLSVAMAICKTENTCQI